MHDAEPADLLIEARWVLPIAPRAAALERHAVAIARGRIAALGPAAQLAERFAPRERIVLGTHALLPGFINAHTRAGELLGGGRRLLGREAWARPEPVRGVADAPAQPRRLAAQSSAERVRDGARLAVAEMLRSGITAFASRDHRPEEVARVAAFARVRAAVGLPVEERTTEWAEGMTGHLAKAEALWDEYKADPWVELHFAPGAAHALSDAGLARIRTIADELDARIAVPVNESAEDIERHGVRHGVRPLRRLDALGLLSPSFSALHLNRLEEAELELLARTGVAAAACPQASLRRGIGCCPIAALLARGVPVGLGSGDPAETFGLDVLAEARAAALVASSKSRTPDALSAQRALELATLGGAAALGLKALAGSIEPGKAADLIALDLSAVARRPEADPAEAIVYGASRDRITHVWINGTPRLLEGRLLAFDETELLELARRWSAPQ
jgi:5-methylthioadenosine/S-adenosylhomocysteine deaminase